MILSKCANFWGSLDTLLDLSSASSISSRLGISSSRFSSEHSDFRGLLVDRGWLKSSRSGIFLSSSSSSSGHLSSWAGSTASPGFSWEPTMYRISVSWFSSKIGIWPALELGPAPSSEPGGFPDRCSKTGGVSEDVRWPPLLVRTSVFGAFPGLAATSDGLKDFLAISEGLNSLISGAAGLMMLIPPAAAGLVVISWGWSSLLWLDIRWRFTALLPSKHLLQSGHLWFSVPK